MKLICHSFFYLLSIFLLITLIILILFNCSEKDQKDITVLSQYKDKTYSEMVELLGSPLNKTGYTIKNAPTKSWNHIELFSKYPQIPQNENVQIMEVTWDDNDFLILACFHTVEGKNRCLVAKRIRKNIKF
jgi:hypothetical protein